MFQQLEQPGIGSYLVPGPPFEFGAFEREPPRPAPALGQHTQEILAEVVGLGRARRSAGSTTTRWWPAPVGARPRPNVNKPDTVRFRTAGSSDCGNVWLRI